jgi:hypothetical protein
MAKARVQINRSNITRSRPPVGVRDPGELYVNWPDLQLGAIGPTKNPLDLIPIRYFSATAQYNTDEMVALGGVIYTAKQVISPGAFNVTQWEVPDAQTLNGQPGSYYLDFANATGTLTSAQHGNQPGGGLHALATTSVAGFMSAADKAKVDGLLGTYVDITGDTMTGPLNLPGGTAAVPSLTFGDVNSGLYGTADQIFITTGGVGKFGVAGGQITSYLAHAFPYGTAAAPGIRWQPDTDTGFWGAANTIHATVGAVTMATFTNTAFTTTVPVSLPGNPTAALDATPKQYVDSGLATKIGDAPADSLTYGRKNNAWVAAVGGASIGTAPPAGVKMQGQLWWDSDSGDTFIWYNDGDSSQWVQINILGSATLTTISALEDSLILTKAPPVGFHFTHANADMWFGVEAGPAFVWNDDKDDFGVDIMSLTKVGDLTVKGLGQFTGRHIIDTWLDETVNTLGPFLYLRRDRATQAANNYLGNIRFEAKNIGSGWIEYAGIWGQIADPTTGNEDGIMHQRVMVSGAPTDRVTLTNAGVTIGGVLLATNAVLTTPEINSPAITGFKNTGQTAHFVWTYNSTTASATGPILLLERIDSHPQPNPPVTNEAIGAIWFRGRNTSQEVVDYARIPVVVENATKDAEDASIYMQLYSNGTFVSRLRAHVNGLDFYGTVTSSGYIYNNSAYFIGADASVILGTNTGASATGKVYLRPVAFNSPAAETTIDTAGNMVVTGSLTTTNGTIYSGGHVRTTQYFFGETTSAVFGNTQSGSLYFRPVGYTNGSKQMVLNNLGDLTVAGKVIAANNFDSTSTTCILSATTGGAIYFRPNGPTSAVEEMILDNTGDLVLKHQVGGVYAGRGIRSHGPSTTGTYQTNWINLHWNGSQNYLYTDNLLTGQVTTPSDYRLKENIQPLAGTWDKVKAMRPVSFTRKAVDVFEAGPEELGFLAHELQEAVHPSAASGVKDGEETQFPNLMVILSAITKALQEAMDRIEALEAA